MDKLQLKLVKRKGKIYERKKDRKNEKEQGEENAAKDEPRILRDTIRQKDSVVNQLAKDKENLQIVLETESENQKIIRDIELEINKETLEKDNNTTRKGPEETEVKE